MSSQPNERMLRGVNEPHVPNLISSCSFLRMPTPAMRVAPELLLNELMRAVFYDNNQDGSGKELSPDDSYDYSNEERFTIRGFSGRQKEAGNRKTYYAAAYPPLARHIKFRKKDPVIVDGFLFEGPIAHFLKSFNATDSVIEQVSKIIVEGLCGDYPAKDTDVNVDVFARQLKKDNDEFDFNTAITKLKDRLHKDIGATQDLGDKITPVLAKTATVDLIGLMKLEKVLPRHYWIALVMGYLRVTMSMWLIQQANNTIKFCYWLERALKGIKIEQHEVTNHFSKPNICYISPSSELSVGLEQVIWEWFRARVKVSVILNELADFKIANVTDELLSKGELYIKETIGSNRISVVKLLDGIANDYLGDQKFLNKCKISTQIASDDAIDTYIIRACGRWPGYKNPLKIKCQGKNAVEFLRVLRKSEGFDERASHLIEQQKSNLQGSKFIPGQLLLQLFVFLANLDKNLNPNINRQLILGDVENHFLKYGIDFTQSPDGRSLLIQMLSDCGLLASTPDAGSSIQISPPFVLDGEHMDSIKKMLAEWK